MASVAITFDVDAMSVWIGSYRATSAALAARGEFAVPATSRILELLDSLAIRATFFVPGHTALAFPVLVDAIIAAGHEVGHHGFVHERVSELDPAQEEDILLRGIEILERHLGSPPVGYRSPSFDFTDATPGLLLRHGFRYDSSLMGSDFQPYWVRDGDRVATDAAFVFGRPIPIVELPVAWLLDDFPHFEFVRGALTAMKPPSAVREIWWGEYRWFAKHGGDGCFTLTLHPECIGRGHRIVMLRSLLEEMAEDGASFATLGEVAERWRAGQVAPAAGPTAG
jgi:peptidoglycan/xylan/chitin deacetylase (PgdA/CDA1 family)